MTDAPSSHSSADTWYYQPKCTDPPEGKESQEQLEADEDYKRQLESSDVLQFKVLRTFLYIDDQHKLYTDPVQENDNQIEIDFVDRMLHLSSSISGYFGISKDIKVSDIRYPAFVRKSAARDVECVIMISFWFNETSEIWSIYLGFDTFLTGLKLVNSIRRLLYMASNSSPLRINRFYPLFSGKVAVSSSRKNTTNPCSEVSSLKSYEKLMPLTRLYLVLDEEAINIYNEVFSSTALFSFRFYKEENKDSVDCIFINNKENIIEIHSSLVVTLEQLGDSYNPKFNHLIKLLRSKSVEPKPMITFSDALVLDQFFRDHPISTESVLPDEKDLELYENFDEDALLCSSASIGRHCMPDPPLTSPATWVGMRAEATSSRDDAGWETVPGNVINVDHNLHTWLDQLLTGSHIDGLDESIQAQWCATEYDLEHLINEGKVPYSSVESAGLNPNSKEHLQKIVNEINDSLFTDKLPLALSHLRGCMKVYGTTLLASIENLPEIEIMKRIYGLSN